MKNANNISTFAIIALSVAGLWVAASAVLPGDESAFGSPAFAAEKAVAIPAPKIDAPVTGKSAVAIFAGGCFWGVEGVYSHVKGVKSVASGYAGGSKGSASYSQVGTGATGHAEAVRIVYDPSQVSYGQLLQIYFSVVADPTQLNRQGPDSGSQYRSAIFPMNAAQATAAQAYIVQLGAGKYWSRPIVTKVERYTGFYAAEAYHQDFMANNPNHPYIRAWDAPKLANLKAMFPTVYKAKSSS